MDTNSLQNFSLANTVCNNLANSFLWKQFFITGPTAGSIMEQFTSLLRLPHRASYIQKLVIGRFVFPWTKQLIDLFPDVWSLVPNLKILILNSPYEMTDKQRGVLTFGGDFTPLIRSLARHGCHLRLRTFSCETWLRPDSDLHRFLLCQVDLQELIGVDLTPSRLIEAGPDFLPSLEVLVCHIGVTAEQLLPHRHIRTLHVYESLDDELSMTSLASAIHNSPGCLTTCRLILFLNFPDFWVDYSGSSLSTLCSSLRDVKVIDFDVFDLPQMDRLPAFLSLEQITFRTVESAVHVNEIAEIARIGQCLSPLLRCLRFKLGKTWWIWNREDLDR